MLQWDIEYFLNQGERWETMVGKNWDMVDNDQSYV